MTTDEKVQRVRELIDHTTRIYRPGEEVEHRGIQGGIAVIDLWIDTPHESTATLDPDMFPVVDVHFFRVSVSRADAKSSRDTFFDIMDDWPVDPAYSPENRLAAGPSYIELGAQIGTFMGQQDAMRLMALGEILGAWRVITPRTLGFTGPEAQRMAGNGFVMVSGYTGR